MTHYIVMITHKKTIIAYKSTEVLKSHVTINESNRRVTILYFIYG